MKSIKFKISNVLPFLYLSFVLFLLISSIICLGRFTDAEATIVGNAILGSLTLAGAGFVFLSAKMGYRGMLRQGFLNLRASGLAVENEKTHKEDLKLRRYIGWLLVQLNTYQGLKMQNLVRGYETQSWLSNDPQLNNIKDGNIDAWLTGLLPLRPQAQEGTLDLLPLMPTKLMDFIDRGNSEIATIVFELGYIRNIWRERFLEKDPSRKLTLGNAISTKLQIVSSAFSKLEKIYTDGLKEGEVHRQNVMARISNEVIPF